MESESELNPIVKYLDIPSPRKSCALLCPSVRLNLKKKRKTVLPEAPQGCEMPQKVIIGYLLINWQLAIVC